MQQKKVGDSIKPPLALQLLKGTGEVINGFEGNLPKGENLKKQQ